MRKIISYLFFFNPFYFISAQTLQVEVSATQVQVNERMAIQYTFNGGNLPGNVLPKVENMMVVGGPSQMQGSSTINGVTTSTSQLTYEVIFTQPGNYTIPAATVKSKSGKFSCQPKKITVIKGKNSNPIIPAGYEGKELLIVMDAEKNKSFLGEPIAIDMVVYSIFINLNITSIDYPTFDGGWTQDATDAFDGQLTPSTYRRKPYYKSVIRRVWMIPSILGEVEFKPVLASFHAGLKDPNAGYLEMNFDSKSEPVKFMVEDVPVDKRPASFINAIGDFSWTVNLDKTKAKANEPIKAMVRITGTGNLPTLEAPVLNLPADFEVFEPKVKNNYKVEIKGINGSKDLEYLIMPRKEGEYWLGPFTFSYLHPTTKKYTTLTSDSFLVNIAGIIADTTKGAAEINHGKFTGAQLYKKSDPFFGNPWYYILLALPFLAGLGMIFFRKKLFFTKKDDTEKKSKQAEDKAYKSLAEAKRSLTEGNSVEALSMLSNLFYQYVCDKMKVNKNEITRAGLEKWLPDMGMKLQAIKILDQLDQFKFAPAALSDLDSLYINIKSLVDELGKK
jgi:hypothetical protein